MLPKTYWKVLVLPEVFNFFISETVIFYYSTTLTIIYLMKFGVRRVGVGRGHGPKKTQMNEMTFYSLKLYWNNIISSQRWIQFIILGVKASEESR